MAEALLLVLSLAGCTAGGDPSASPSRPRNPFAPSLPLLTQQEEAQLDRIIDRFMLYDTGQLRGLEGQEALREFEKLGPEAIPALIRGINRAAGINHSCPMLVISKKLRRFLMASNDAELLEFAQDNIGSGVGPTRYAGILRDLRFQCGLRKNFLARQPRPAPGGAQLLAGASTENLLRAASIESGARLRGVVQELGRRGGKEVLGGLGTAALSSDASTRELSRTTLDRVLAGLAPAVARESLAHPAREVRLAAIRVIAARHSSLTGDLIPLLTDGDEEVRAGAHQSLVKISRGLDLGPLPGADEAAREQARSSWAAWWERVKP